MEAFRNRLIFVFIRQLRKMQLCKSAICASRRSYEKRWRQWFRWRPQLLMAVTASGFSFQDNGISDEEMLSEARSNGVSDSQEWEVVRDEENSKVLRRLHEDTGLYEFRCTGSYYDITPSDFVDAQMNLVFRQKWDTNVEKLELVSKDEKTDSELIHWISKFPYPMYPREYVFVRRRFVDENDHCIVIASCAVDDSAKIIPLCEKKYVRVQTYRSVMVVRAHQNFDSKGFDYILSYYDNPESNIPKYVYSWLINSGGPYYLEQVHEAAKQLERSRTEISNKNIPTKDAELLVDISEKETDDEFDEKDKVEVRDVQEVEKSKADSNGEVENVKITKNEKSEMAFHAPGMVPVRCVEKSKAVHLRECFIFVD